MEKLSEERLRDLGRAIASARTAMGMTQTELAYSIGYTNPSHVSRIENGRKSPNLRTLYAIADACDVDIVYFFMKVPEDAVSDSAE